MSATSEKLEVIILGSGSSCTTPNLACLTRDETSVNPPCRCCASIYEDTEDARAAGGKKNIRGNISAVVRKTWADGKQRYVNRWKWRKASADLAICSTILIDCGKTFNRSVVDYFPPNGIRKIDGKPGNKARQVRHADCVILSLLAVLLTHDHADGMSTSFRSVEPQC